MTRSTFRSAVFSRVASAGIAAALVILLADGLSAQTLRGRITEGRTQVPMADVAVSLLDPDANVLAQTTSGPSGGFVLEAPGPGEYYVRAEKLSYTTVTDGIFVFQTEEAEMSIALFMLPQPTEIEGIDVRVAREQQRRTLRSAGFYQRAAQGFGRFIGPEEMERRPVFTFSELLRGIPGIRFQDEAIQFSGGLEGTCSPNIFIDGARVFQDFGITTLIQPDEVAGVEVYRGAAQTPLEWGGLNASCGVILIWTKTSD